MFVIVSFEFSLRPEQRKVPETSGMSTFVIVRSANGYQITHKTCRGAGGKETKAYPTIRIPTNHANWGLPKRERRKAMTSAPENPARQRSRHSSQREG